MSVTQPTQPQDLDTSSEDAGRIYRAIFGTRIPERVAERFRSPSAQLVSMASVFERREYRYALDEIRDLEALEVAARYRGRLSLLSKQFRLMVHVAETLPANLPLFVNRRDSLPRGLTTILLGGVRTAFKLVVGLMALRGLPRA